MLENSSKLKVYSQRSHDTHIVHSQTRFPSWEMGETFVKDRKFNVYITPALHNFTSVPPTPSSLAVSQFSFPLPPAMNDHKY